MDENTSSGTIFYLCCFIIIPLFFFIVSVGIFIWFRRKRASKSDMVVKSSEDGGNDGLTAMFKHPGSNISSEYHDESYKILDQSKYESRHDEEMPSVDSLSSNHYSGVPDTQTITHNNINQIRKVGELCLGRLMGAVLTPDKKQIVILRGSYIELRKLKNWELDRIFSSSFSPSNFGTKICISYDGQLVAVSTDYTINVWEISSGKLITIIEEAGRDIKFHPNNKWIIVSAGNHIKILEVHDGQLLKEFKADSNFDNICVSSDGKFVGVLGNSNFSIWDLNTGNKIFGLGGSSVIAKFDDNKRFLVSYQSEIGLKMWSYGDWELLFTIPYEELVDDYGINDIAISSDGTVLAFLQNDRITVWKNLINELRCTLEITNPFINDTIERSFIEFSEGNSNLIIGSERELRIFRIETGKLRCDIRFTQSEGGHLDFSPNGKEISTCSSVHYQSGGIFRLWSMKDGQEALDFYAEKIVIGGNVIASLLSPYDRDHVDNFQISFIELNGNKTIRKWEFKDKIFDIDISRDGNYLAIVDERNISYWGIKEERNFFKIDNNRCDLVKLNESGNMLVSFQSRSGLGWNSQRVYLWKLNNNKRPTFAYEIVHPNYYFKNHTYIGTDEWGEEEYEDENSNDIYTAIFSPNGRMLATEDYKGIIRLWDLSNGQLMHDLNKSSDNPRIIGNRTGTLSFSPDNQFIASLGHIWRVTDGSLIKKFDNVEVGVAFSPNNKLVAVESAGIIKFYGLPPQEI